MKQRAVLFIIGSCLSLGNSFVNNQAKAKDASETVTAELEKAIEKATVASYVLRYKFRAAERLQWKVTHLVTVETKIQGTTQKAETRSRSTKSWQVTSVNSNGDVTFAHIVDEIDMWQKVTGRQEVRYNSRKDNEPPPEYENAAASVGIPLSTITLKATGEIINRDDRRKTPGFGGEAVTVPLPEKAIEIGETWSNPYNIHVKLNDGTVTNIKSRQVFKLEKVVFGLATISVHTEVLTPVKDPRLRVQLVQRLINGTIKFDMDRGRVTRQRMDLDESVLAFNGADSSMRYKARFTEELVSADIVGIQRRKKVAKLEKSSKHKTKTSRTARTKQRNPKVRR